MKIRQGSARDGSEDSGSESGAAALDAGQDAGPETRIARIRRMSATTIDRYRGGGISRRERLLGGLCSRMEGAVDAP